MPLFHRRSLNDRMDSRWFLQPVRSIDASDDGIALLIGNDWQRYAWAELGDPTLSVFKTLWPASPWRKFMPRPIPRTMGPDEVIALMERRRVENASASTVFWRKAGMPTMEFLSFRASDKTVRINLSSVGSHFENSETLRKILLDSLHPKTVNSYPAHDANLAIPAIIVFMIGCALVAGAVSTYW